MEFNGTDLTTILQESLKVQIHKNELENCASKIIIATSHRGQYKIRPCNLVNYTVEVHNKTIHFSLSLCLSLSYTHGSTCVHTRKPALTIITVTAATAKWIEVIFWLGVALRIRGQGRCLTPCQTRQNLSCQSQRRNFWITLDQVRLEMTKQGAKNDNYKLGKALVSRWNGC